MSNNIESIVKFLKENDFFYILTHQYPDGDTLGSACALCMMLQQSGKHAKILCNDIIPEKFSYMFNNIKQEDFDYKNIIAVDIADTQLLGDNLSVYSQKIDICIDHHASNKRYAKVNFVDPKAAATAEIIYTIINSFKSEWNCSMAECIYTGISTDTGCFRYTNATPRTYRIAAEMIEYGVNAADINRVMFDMKSRARLEVERRVLDDMEFFFDSKCSVIYLTKDMIKEANAKDGDIDGLASIPRQIEGVIIGVTMREKEDGVFKISVRTDGNIDASKICSEFDGGGHPAAAGCSIAGGLDNAKTNIVNAIGKALGECV